ncbi:hypothetical protein BDZ91DRAFT_751039 [Kalaharituber pfeilii]|nr:hypothetical protein BDZ91DRAFT_751039 [Kalaharituber pfeilii]
MAAAIAQIPLICVCSLIYTSYNNVHVSIPRVRRRGCRRLFISGNFATGKPSAEVVIHKDL